MTHAMRICVDIDNVITATDVVMRRIIENVTNGRVSLAYNDVVEFDYHECMDSNGHAITRDEWRIVHSRFSTPGELATLAPLEGALEGLHTIAGLAKLHLVTTRLPCSRKSTIEWLETKNVPEHSLHFVQHAEKHVALRSFDLAIEDHYEQAVSFINSGTPTVLIRHPWNLAKPKVAGIHWVDGWEEVVARIGDMIKTHD